MSLTPENSSTGWPSFGEHFNPERTLLINEGKLGIRSTPSENEVLTKDLIFGRQPCESPNLQLRSQTAMLLWSWPADVG
jgi:hypothetical protein